MLSDKAALVTGGTGGIGFAVADALAAQGCAIMLNGLGDGSRSPLGAYPEEARIKSRPQYNG